MFLTVDELRELTGYVYNSRQIDWLRRNNWKFEVTAQMRPKVARSFFESRLGASAYRQAVELVSTTVRPNFQALNRKKGR
ncbi:DUF4224 domain-containing protein [Collimonas sp.]|uniref:DUF4224 domain-containing protein n=1 Tax=Collimonas sp. TaxID=1963772 RepID=UPI003264FB89